MLPELELRDVSREDVDRIAAWLDDSEVSSQWFGHYACGDPVHRGYEPGHMLEASDGEWQQVFRRDRDRVIASIYAEPHGHVGECQIVMHGRGEAELFLLIGRKELWHQGYGTAAVIELLERAFGHLQLNRTWVSVPEDNLAALGLFKKLGFVHEDTRTICRGRDGGVLRAYILALGARGFRDWSQRRRPRSVPVVTITGLPGARAAQMGRAVAKATGTRFMDGEIDDRVAQRLGCSVGEIVALEESCESAWRGFLREATHSWEWYSAFVGTYGGYGWVGPWTYHEADLPSAGYLTKEAYLKALRAVIRNLSVEGSAVLYGHGAHLWVPSNVGAVRIFVAASRDLRWSDLVDDSGEAPSGADRMENADLRAVAVHKKLYGSDLQDADGYDLTLNMDRLSTSSALRAVTAMLEAAVDASSAAPIQDAACAKQS